MPPVDLVVNPCRSQCRWLGSRAGAKLFTCRGCGSQWQPGQGWTPVNADGHVPAAVRSALAAGGDDRPATP